mmetsp:Transcript_14100/g.49645  ORF Transcript_14100/g.49645 Transcript_14100/m.49645 type:complete len:204 (-) Transcript_14100:438-1049(-)
MYKPIAGAGHATHRHSTCLAVLAQLRGARRVYNVPALYVQPPLSPSASAAAAGAAAPRTAWAGAAAAGRGRPAIVRARGGTQTLHWRHGSSMPSSGSGLQLPSGEHSLQTHLPQRRQWCLRTKIENRIRQSSHLAAISSAVQTGAATTADFSETAAPMAAARMAPDVEAAVGGSTRRSSVGNSAEPANSACKRRRYRSAAGVW